MESSMDESSRKGFWTLQSRKSFHCLRFLPDPLMTWHFYQCSIKFNANQERFLWVGGPRDVCKTFLGLGQFLPLLWVGARRCRLLKPDKRAEMGGPVSTWHIWKTSFWLSFEIWTIDNWFLQCTGWPGRMVDTSCWFSSDSSGSWWAATVVT